MSSVISTCCCGSAMLSKVAIVHSVHSRQKLQTKACMQSDKCYASDESSVCRLQHAQEPS